MQTSNNISNNRSIINDCTANLIGLKAFGRRDSLIDQASVDRVQNETKKRRSTIKRRKELEERSTICKQLIQRLNDYGVDFLIQQLNIKDSDLIFQKSIVFSLIQDSQINLPVILQKLINSGIKVKHIETRPDKANDNELELLVECCGVKSAFLDALTKITIENQTIIDRIHLCEISSKSSLESNIETDSDSNGFVQTYLAPKSCWYPKHVSDLDFCAHVVVKYQPTEDPKHPGYGDEKYIKRREELNEIANTYHYYSQSYSGEPIPFIKYTAEENETWRLAYTELKKLRLSHTCTEYQENIARMEEEGLITADAIPQLSVLSQYIQKRTGFELRPCGGLLSARDFLATLAFRVFQSTLYVRHASKPNHCPEPDIIHEVLGHCPMFSNPLMAQMSQEIGLMSLGATDEQIERLSTVYWFIIEFGLCQQDGKLKAIGAGLISAFGELQHACSDVPDHEPFIPEITALKEYEDSDYQPLYFVAESIKDAMERLKNYARKLCPKHETLYNPFTRTVEQLPINSFLSQRLDNLSDNILQIKQLVQQISLH